MVVKRDAGMDTLDNVCPVSGCTNELPDSQNMNTRIFLRVCILDEGKFDVWRDARDFCKIDKLGNPLTLALQVKAGILKGVRLVDYRLSNVLDLVLCRDLVMLSLVMPELEGKAYNGLCLMWSMR